MTHGTHHTYYEGTLERECFEERGEAQVIDHEEEELVCVYVRVEHGARMVVVPRWAVARLCCGGVVG